MNLTAFFLRTFLLGSLWLPVNLLAQRLPLPSDSIILIRAARAWVDTLCSPALVGRGYLDEGHARAAKLIGDTWGRWGIEPIGEYGDFYQYFPIQINVPRGARVELQGKNLTAGQDFIVNRYSGSGTLSGKVVDMGYGLEPSEQAAGNIVLFRDGWPPELANDSEGRAAYQDLAHLPNRLSALLEAGAKGFIIVQNKLTAALVREALPVPAVEVRADALPRRVRRAALSVQSGPIRIRTQNVVGRIPGTGDTDSAIVLCAHYDHLGRIEEGLFAGANDNASGTTMLMSMAEHYAAHPLRHDLILIAFGAEETGLLGSRYYVQEDPRWPLERTAFVLNLDLMGNGVDGIMAVGGVDYPAYFERLQALNEAMQAVPVVRARRNAPNSDHYFFLEKGIPGFFIYTLGGPPHYHDVNDTPANLELSRYVNVRALLMGLLEEVGK
ncbi:MAG: M28 family peptidase [Bacteroidetes bacterium]|nr:MAG: M28 family peptidase [Bacteroidota bacterium]